MSLKHLFNGRYVSQTLIRIPCSVVRKTLLLALSGFSFNLKLSNIIDMIKNKLLIWGGSYRTRWARAAVPVCRSPSTWILRISIALLCSVFSYVDVSDISWSTYGSTPKYCALWAVYKICVFFKISNLCERINLLVVLLSTRPARQALIKM